MASLFPKHRGTPCCGRHVLLHADWAHLLAMLKQAELPLVQRCQRLLVRAGMFDNLSQRLDKAWDLVRKDGKLTSENIKEPMREIRRALLEADVRSSSLVTFLKALTLSVVIHNIHSCHPSVKGVA